MPCFVYGSDIRIAIPCLYIPEMTYTTCRSADLPEDYNTTWISSGLCKSCLSRLSPFLFRNVSNYQRKAQSGGKYSTNLFSALIVFSGITYTPVRVCTWLHVTRVICFSSRSLFARARACVRKRFLFKFSHRILMVILYRSLQSLLKSLTSSILIPVIKG